MNARKTLDTVFSIHAGVCVLVGFICCVLPHSIVHTVFGSVYTHFVPEMYRLYGTMNISEIGYNIRKYRCFNFGARLAGVSDSKGIECICA